MPLSPPKHGALVPHRPAAFKSRLRVFDIPRSCRHLFREHASPHTFRMDDSDQTEIAIPQREVQRLLGRCLIRVQQYEKLLKVMVAWQELSGTLQTLPGASDARLAETSDKTLGALVGRLMGTCIVPAGNEPPDYIPDQPEASIHVQLRTHFAIQPDAYEALKVELRELVTLRNTLVHHFIEQHDIGTVEGCLHAQESLRSAYNKIDRHFNQLMTFAGHMDEAKQEMARLVQTPEFREMIVNGIEPNGQIHWHMAGIVRALREAYRELAVDGWVNLDAAARWVSEHRPEQTPQKYGCSRWRHVIHESNQFELRRFTHNGVFGAWFREYPKESTKAVGA